MRLINFRTFPIIFALTAVGVLFSLTACFLFPLGVALLGCLTAGIIALGVMCAVRRETYKAITFMLALAVSAVTCAMFFVTAEDYANPEVGEKLIIGRVTEHYEYTDDGFIATLTDLSFDGMPISGNAELYLNGARESFYETECGYIIGMRAEPIGIELFGGSVNVSAVRSGLKYRIYADSDKLAGIEPGEGTPLETMRIGLREHLLYAMGDEAGSVAYGMTAGDRFLLSDEVSDTFAKTGIGHILAVSGLHIGLIAALITRLLSLCRLPMPINRIITTVLLLAYVVFTGGSPSAVRAFIMYTIFLFAPVFGRRDPLNSLCLAGTVCLCISPYYLFDCGFLMSMCAVGGLILFSSATAKFLQNKLKLPKFAANAVSAALSVQLAITPVTAVFFKQLYLYSLPVNALFMGALGAMFSFLVLCLPLSFALPALLVPSGFFIKLMLGACSVLSGLPAASITIQLSPLALALPAVLFLMSRFVMSPHKKFVNLVLTAVLFTVAIGSENGLKDTDAMLAVGGSDTLTVIYDGDERYLIGDLTDADAAVNAIRRSRVSETRFTVYTTTLNEKTAEGITELSRTFDITEVRFAMSGDISGLKTIAATEIPLVGTERSDGKFDVATVGGKVRGWLYTSHGKTAFVSDGFAPEFVTEAADVVRCKYAYEKTPSAVYMTSWSGGDYVTDYNSSYMFDFSIGKVRKV